ncbi:hypothetical protein EYC84_010852 [Monilinia fructicola]|uniref:Uncharacterized protein n=1 Tax=Monilinia fructicola TaxID=38448 RepID=A0A5M9JB58_MONFR|nr:hypothetical protein EYC84_010852 [Monilinia fructicola]
MKELSLVSPSHLAFTLWAKNLLLTSKCVSLAKTERIKLLLCKIPEGGGSTLDGVERKVYMLISQGARSRGGRTEGISTHALAKLQMSCIELALISREYKVSKPDIILYSTLCPKKQLHFSSYRLDSGFTLPKLLSEHIS